MRILRIVAFVHRDIAILPWSADLATVFIMPFAQYGLTVDADSQRCVLEQCCILAQRIFPACRRLGASRRIEQRSFALCDENPDRCGRRDTPRIAWHTNCV